MADWLAATVDDRIDRRVKTGASDKGDIAGLRLRTGQRIVAELKDVMKLDLAGWVREAEAERINDAATAGICIHKRRGISDPGSQYVTCTLRDLVAIITGERPE